ncbi:hypothetical protein [Nocardioides limicola]|uniref:hypothetical protein n=1 Tax=Nocardioides limicola TaxID=2803368 RepID=UPI00193BFCDD|nr:hypothetical protein [Nocardioides sp. DJM-14]
MVRWVTAVNAKDGGSRRFIAVQLPEPTDDADAKRAGFDTIADISRKRIDAAGEQVKAELAGQTVDVDQITAVMEGGEKAFRLRKEKYGF